MRRALPAALSVALSAAALAGGLCASPRPAHAADPVYILLNLAFIAAGWLPREWNVLTGLLALLGGAVAAVIAVAGVLGDLTESGWKRALGLKDFSALLGAQGGVLDRFDGLIFAAPVYYLLLVLANKL